MKHAKYGPFYALVSRLFLFSLTRHTGLWPMNVINFVIFCLGPVCSPTRGTVLTGRNHNRYCVWTANAGNNKPDFAVPERMPLPSYEYTIATAAQSAGYATAMFGKW